MKKLLFFIFCFISHFCFGSIIIDSVKISESNCQKNGAIVIFAKTDRPPMVYSILEGPEVRQAQSGNSFTSLAKGIYKVLITNFANDSLIRSIEIRSSYVQPDFTISYTNSSCNNNNDGTITGVATNTSKKPLVWELKNITKGTTITQNNGNFTGISNDSYSLRLYDSCQNFVTRFVDLTNYDTKIKSIGCSLPSFKNCDTVNLIIRIETPERITSSFYGEFSYNGIIITRNLRIERYIDLLKEYWLSVDLPNLDFNSTIKIKVFNECNDNIERIDIFDSFQFIPEFEVEGENCDILTNLSYRFPFYSSCTLEPIYPIKLEFKDVLNNSILINDILFESDPLFIPQQLPDREYQTIITDNCGHIYLHKFVWPKKIKNGIPNIIIELDGLVTFDSTTSVRIKFFNFIGPSLQLLEAPEYLRSTQLRYEFQAEYNKQKIYKPYEQYFRFNLGVGDFKFRIFDDCNNELIFNIQITPDMVGSYTDVFYPTIGCLNQSSLKIKSNLSCKVNGNLNRINNIYELFKGNTKLENRNLPPVNCNEIDSIIFNNLDSGIYNIRHYISLFSNNFIVNIQGKGNYFVGIFGTIYHVDSIIIPPYIRPEIDYVTSFECSGDIYVNLIPDFEKGVAPYEYEVISGPILYPLQPSNLFTFQKNGIYTARIIDACGNANVFNFSVDTLIFPPIEKFGSTCVPGLVKLAYPTSVYFTYKWEKPNGLVFIGDTLYINNAGPADTGLYVITRYVNINGCRDSIKTTYRLEQNLTINIQRTICEGDTLYFYGQTLTEEGVYSHLVETSGCDSVISLKLLIKNSPRVETTSKICKGDTILFYGEVLTEAGIYSHTIPSLGCDSIIILNLQVTNPTLESTSKICKGDTLIFYGQALKEAGIYLHTIPTIGCDSIITLNLQVTNPILVETTSKICKGDNFIFSGEALTEAGLYSHIIPTIDCDSIIRLNLQITNSTLVEVNYTVCKGDSVKIGNQYYTNEGQFNATLLNNEGCDSIIKFSIEFENPYIQISASANEALIGDSVQLFSNVNQQNITYYWSPENNFSYPNVSDPFALLDTSRWFYVKAVSENGCISMDSIFIEVSENCKDENIYIPNAFTPNGDGINDVLRIKSNFNLDEITLIILNRNGEKVFETNQQTIGWDGMYKGKKAPNDVYAYYFKGRCNGLIIERKGNITLLGAE